MVNPDLPSDARETMTAEELAALADCSGILLEDIRRNRTARLEREAAQRGQQTDRVDVNHRAQTTEG